jgi:hypothetical protein
VSRRSHPSNRVKDEVLDALDRGTNTGTDTAVANARWNCPGGSTFTFIGLGCHTASGGHLPADTRNEQTVTC